MSWFLGELANLSKLQHCSGSRRFDVFAVKSASTAAGLVLAFPDLDDNEDGGFPAELISMKMTPDGTAWWFVGQRGHIREVG